MKKLRKTKRFIAAFTTATLLGTSFPTTEYNSLAMQTWETTEDGQESAIDTENYDYLTLNGEMKEKAQVDPQEMEELEEIFADASQVEADSEEVESTFPDALDLSQTDYFPAIGDQGATGSCGYYSIFYTNLTYVYNRTKGIKTTESNTISPMFGYNFLGVTEENSYKLIQQIGFPTIGVLPIDQSNQKTLNPVKEVWESALNHRAAEIETISNYGEEDDVITGPKDASLNQIKWALNNGLPMGFGTLTTSWNFSVVASGEHKGEVAIDRCDSTYGGGHSVSIVGYDDNIWIDINYDGEVQKAELGAFKFANSWGTDWGNDGFAWVAYDAFNAKSQILTDSEQTRINKLIDDGIIKANKVNNDDRKSFSMFKDHNRPKVRETDNSGCLCYLTMNTGSRKEMTILVTATSKTDGTEYSYQFPKLNDKEDLAWDGTTDATDGTIVFDLENAVPGISSSNMSDYTWTVTFGEDTLDSYSLTIKDLYFTVDGTKKYTTNVSGIPINGTEKVYTMVSDTEEAPVTEEENLATIYYSNSNFSSAYIHYRVGSGTWTTAPGMQMCNSSEQSGYTWKYVIDAGDNTEVTVCFNNGNDIWDSNSSKDYTISVGTYGVKDAIVTKLTPVVITPTPTVTPVPTEDIIETEIPTVTESPAITETEIPAQTDKPTQSPSVIPDETEQPAETTPPDGTEDFTQTTTPGETDAPNKTAIPVETDIPEKTTEPDGTDNPMKTAEPDETDNPTKTETPDETDNPTKTGTPDETDNPTKTGTPDGTDNPMKTVTPNETDNPTKTVGPDETDYPEKTAIPDEVGNSTNTTIPDKTVTSSATPTPAQTSTPTITATPSITATPKVTETIVWDTTTASANGKTIKLVRLEEKDKYTVYAKKKVKLKVDTDGSALVYQVVKKGNALGSTWKNFNTFITLKKTGILYIKYTLNGEERIRKTVGIVIDKKKPVITISGKTLKAVDKDSGVQSIKVNGKKVKNNTKLKSGKNKIVVVDKAGNKTTKIIKIQ